MDFSSVIKAVAEYGLGNVMSIALIVYFIKVSDKLLKVIEHNSELIGKVSSVMEKCSKK